jgi:hypothetical protein
MQRKSNEDVVKFETKSRFDAERGPYCQGGGGLHNGQQLS